MTRIAIGKAVGFAVGLLGFIFLPFFQPDVGWLFRWGILLWYMTLGAIVGVFGVFAYHPILKIPMPWWFCAPIIGGWMNFVLSFFTYDVMKEMMITMFGEGGNLTSPFWFTAEGGLFGLLTGYLATRFGGEGKETVDR